MNDNISNYLRTKFIDENINNILNTYIDNILINDDLKKCIKKCFVKLSICRLFNGSFNKYYYLIETLFLYDYNLSKELNNILLSFIPEKKSIKLKPKPKQVKQEMHTNANTNTTKRIYNLPSYKNNSCFLDTFFVSILLNPPKIIMEKIINNNNIKPYLSNLQRYINDLYKTINFSTKNTKYYIDDIRAEIIKLSRKQQSKINTSFAGSQEDIADIYTYIFDLFNIYGDATAKITSYFTNLKDDTVKITDDIIKNAPLVETKKSHFEDITVYTNDKSHNVIDLQSYIKSDVRYIEKKSGEGFGFKDGMYNTKISHYSYDTDIIYIRISRYLPDGSKSNKYVNFPDKLELMEGKKLNLRSVCFHEGSSIKSGHYISYNKVNDIWYFYDDMNPSLSLIGSYQDMIKHNSNRALTESCGLLYALE